MSRTILVVTCVALLLAGMILAQDKQEEKKHVNLTGTWDMSVETPNGTGTPVLKLKQDGDKLTGEYEGRMGAGQVSGTVKGNEVAMTVNLNIEGNIFAIRYTGQIVDPDKMMGEAEFGEYGSGNWNAKRRKS